MKVVVGKTREWRWIGKFLFSSDLIVVMVNVFEFLTGSEDD